MPVVLSPVHLCILTSCLNAGMAASLALPLLKRPGPSGYGKCSPKARGPPIRVCCAGGPTSLTRGTCPGRASRGRLGRGRFHVARQRRMGRRQRRAGRSEEGPDGVKDLISTDLQAGRKRSRAGREAGSNFYIVYFLFKRVVSLSARAARRRWFYH